MQDVIDMLDIVVWPVTVLVLALGFHAQLSALRAHVSRIGYDGFSVRFQRLVGPAEQALRAAILEPGAALTDALDRRSATGDGASLVMKALSPSSQDSNAIRALAAIRDDALTTDDREVTHNMALRYVRLAGRARRRTETGT